MGTAESINTSQRKINAFIVMVWLYLLGLAIIVTGLSLNSFPSQFSLHDFLLSRGGSLLIGSLMIVSLSLFVILRYYILCQQGQARFILLYMAMSLIALGVLTISLEVTMRLLAKPSPSGETFLNAPLPPKSWDQTKAHYRKLIDQSTRHSSFLVYDRSLGWTIGGNKQSSNSLYFSSEEGLRAQHSGIQFAQHSSPVRIALVGDSFTFGEEVRFEETWGHHLANDLGADVQILNFGVSGYGLDQSYLRFQKDVLSWKPSVVILGFIQADLWRSMTLYSFINFENWEFTFAKPRFIRTNGTLSIINSPPPPPEDIFSRQTISDLPFVRYDIGFNLYEWNSTILDWFYLARVARTYLTPHPPHSLATQNDLTQINSQILQDFLSTAKKSNIVPLIVYFPSRADFPEGSTEPFGVEFIKRSKLPHVNLTECLSEIPPQERFVSGGVHYSAKGNAAVARCLGPLIHETMRKRNVQIKTNSQNHNQHQN